MELLKLDKKVRTLWLIRNMIFVVLIFGSYLAICLSVEPAIMLSMFIGLGIPAILSIVILILWPFWKYNLYSYGYDEKRILINYGVIFKHRILVPIRQTQDIHLYNGPIMTLLDLSGVIISTAGSNFTISGMLKDDATKLVYELEERLNVRLDGDPDEEI